MERLSVYFVVALADESGAKVVNYEYDAWGQLINIPESVTTGNGELLREANPFRYSGYQFDPEIGLYCLKSRYYTANLGRFLTRDKNTEVNLYAYCENNPVIRIDEDGEFWNLLIGAGAGALISGGVTMAVNISQGKAWHEGIGIAMASGAITGALAASGFGLSGQIIGNALIGGIGSGLSEILDIKKDKSQRLTSRENLSKIVSIVTTGAVIGAGLDISVGLGQEQDI